jgi:cytochrome P450
MENVEQPHQNTIGGNQDDRKSAQLAARYIHVEPGVQLIRRFAFAREILRSNRVKQAGAGAEHVDVGNPDHVPVFYLDGEAHKLRRAAIAKFFTRKEIATRHRFVMERTTDDLLARLRTQGEARLDQISFELAAAVASEIVGLTQSDPRKMAPRLAALLASSFTNDRGLKRLVHRARQFWFGYQFYVNDVKPAVQERRKRRREDIISQTLDMGYSDRAIMIECLTYATAGMVTTREFIVMAAWHLFDRPELRARFIEADETGQLAILQEILRLDPIAGLIFRRVDEEIPLTCEGRNAPSTCGP